MTKNFDLTLGQKTIAAGYYNVDDDIYLHDLDVEVRELIEAALNYGPSMNDATIVEDVRLMKAAANFAKSKQYSI